MESLNVQPFYKVVWQFLVVAQLLSCVQLGNQQVKAWTLQHTRLPCPSPTSRACSDSCPSSQWCDLTISPSFIPFSSCLQSFPASKFFPTSQFFTSGGPRIGASALALVLPMNIQDWFPLGFTGLISLLSKGVSRVFSSTTTVWKHKFLGTQPFLLSSFYIHAWLLEKS